jgi:hypothetical protein
LAITDNQEGGIVYEEAVHQGGKFPDGGGLPREGGSREEQSGGLCRCRRENPDVVVIGALVLAGLHPLFSGTSRN